MNIRARRLEAQREIPLLKRGTWKVVFYSDLTTAPLS
jgi:hypothetical protein